jgi:hypothetical protein
MTCNDQDECIRCNDGLFLDMFATCVTDCEIGFYGHVAFDVEEASTCE